MIPAKDKNKWQFGDFQTPIALSERVISILRKDTSFCPETVLEPSCGKGSFLHAAIGGYPNAKVLGFDVNPGYVDEARSSIRPTSRAVIEVADFFMTDWAAILSNIEGPLLILGNPPWVTSSELGLLNSKNLPSKANFQDARGIEAITGSSNFDISEWMLLRYVDWLTKHPGKLAVLCKYSVARKIFRRLPKQSRSNFLAEIYPVDAKLYFSASVEACLFVLGNTTESSRCAVYSSLDADTPKTSIGLRDGELVRDPDTYDQWRHLAGQDARYIWRSGIKHDCSRVMELTEKGKVLYNGLGEVADIEQTYVYPLLKSSDIANGRGVEFAHRYVLVPQTYVGQETDSIKYNAPRTWRYLNQHANLLDARTSKVYKAKSRFSVFGVGDYTFAPWKVAISGLYKRLEFAIVGPFDNRPVVFDDTVYFLACQSEDEAKFIISLLQSRPADEFFRSLIFWDEKRPITARILRQLNIRNLACQLNAEYIYLQYAGSGTQRSQGQLTLGIAEDKSIRVNASEAEGMCSASRKLVS